jgi:transposase-like protein
MIGRARQMNWKDLSGAERYRVVEMARKGEVPIPELCRSFGVSRQTLSLAVEKAESGARAALEPRSPGRKGPSPAEAELARVLKEKMALEQDVGRWKQKYEIAMTFVDLHRKLLNGEALPGEEDPPPRKKKPHRRLRHPSSSRNPGSSRSGTAMERSSDGGGDGSAEGES